MFQKWSLEKFNIIRRMAFRFNKSNNHLCVTNIQCNVDMHHLHQINRVDYMAISMSGIRASILCAVKVKYDMIRLDTSAEFNLEQNDELRAEPLSPCFLKKIIYRLALIYRLIVQQILSKPIYYLFSHSKNLGSVYITLLVCELLK